MAARVTCPDQLKLKPTRPQAAFLFKCRERRFPLFVGGYGSGKTQTKIDAALSDMLQYPGIDYGLYAPTFQLMKLSDWPRIEEWLEQRNIPYTSNKADFTFHIHGYGKLILRSIDKPETIIAYETHRAGIDEIDTLQKTKAEDVFRRVMARTRGKMPPQWAHLHNQVRTYSTPEGYRFCYQRWGKGLSPGYAMVRAPTWTNQYLPPDYEDTLRENYSPELVDAYIEGLFVNLTHGSVYPSFDRELNDCKTTIQPREPLFIGQDFNVNIMASVVGVLRYNERRQEELHIVEEIFGLHDTPDLIEHLNTNYKAKGHSITMYPDAAGNSRTTLDATTTDIVMLSRAGIALDHPQANPPVKDRVRTVNAMLCNDKEQRRLRVNVDACPKLTDALETQAYDIIGRPEKPGGPDDPSHINDALGYMCHQRYRFDRPVTGTMKVKWP